MNAEDEKWSITYNSEYNGRLVMLHNGVIGKIVGYKRTPARMEFIISTKHGRFEIPGKDISAFGVD